MVLVKSVKFGHVFIFRQMSQKNEFNIILEQKNAFKTIKKRSLKNRRIGIFSKGLVHGLDQKCEIWPFFPQNKTKKKCVKKFKKSKN